MEPSVQGLRKTGLALALLVGGGGLAQAEEIRYTILMDGKPIGWEVTSLARDGDRIQVKIETETKVKVMFLNFHYHHQRTEDWVDGRFQGMVADTDDDGSNHHVEIHRRTNGFDVVADGARRSFEGDLLPLTLWDKAVVGQPLLIGVVDGEVYRVQSQSMGAEQVALAGGSTAATHWHMAGEVERELWYDQSGSLVKTTFERRGYPIQIVRN